MPVRATSRERAPSRIDADLADASLRTIPYSNIEPRERLVLLVLETKERRQRAPASPAVAAATTVAATSGGPGAAGASGGVVSPRASTSSASAKALAAAAAAGAVVIDDEPQWEYSRFVVRCWYIDLERSRYLDRSLDVDG